MARYWWVNHKQTSREEIRGGYLWSPKLKRDGSSNLFYSNMRRAEPGDCVLSYAGGYVKYVGQVSWLPTIRQSGFAREFIAEIDDSNESAWRTRILKFSETRSDDLATFPVYYDFLELLGQRRPQLAIQLLSVVMPTGRERSGSTATSRCWFLV